jgi:hypothetical protein
MTGADPALQAEAAEEIARKDLESKGLTAELVDRPVSVRADGDGYAVTFALPAGRRGGDFVVRIDAAGNVCGRSLGR